MKIDMSSTHPLEAIRLLEGVIAEGLICSGERSAVVDFLKHIQSPPVVRAPMKGL